MRTLQQKGDRSVEAAAQRSGGGMSAGRHVQAAWLIAVLTTLGVAGIGLVFVYTRPDLLQIDQFVDLLASIGLSRVATTTISFLVPIVAAAVVVGVVFVAKRDDAFALLFALALLGLFVFNSGSPRAVAIVLPSMAPVAIAVEVMALSALVLTLFLFPDGRFKPAWTKPVAYSLAGSIVLFPWVPATARTLAADPDAVPSGRVVVTGALAFLVIVTSTAAQTARYRRFAGVVERQQMRWVLLGFGSVVVPALAVIVGTASGGDRFVAWVLLGMALTGPVLPIVATIALLKYQLFELDRILRLTISWVSLTALLAASYLILVFSLQALLRPVTGESNVIVAASTLAVAALFAPARRRVQAFVDRRFYRSHYDARRTIEAFSARLRDESDLNSLLEELHGVVADSLQPSSLSIWVRVDGLHRLGQSRRVD